MSRATDDRGQLVLVTALALALVLVSLGVAYLQLGYHEDVRPPDQEPAAQLEAVLERTLDETAAEVPDTYGWDDRTEAVQAVRDELNDTNDHLETSRLDAGHVYHIALNETRTDRWVSTNCPRGPDRQFGTCETIDGVAVQERTDRTHILAAAFDFTMTTPDGEISVTVVIEPRVEQ
jgi:hypothetical protein